MKLADLRRFSVRGQQRVRFRLRNGMECVVTEHGIAQVPALKGVPDFNLENELADAGEFLVEPAAADGGRKVPAPQRLSREELARMVSAPAAAAVKDEEE